MQDKENYLVCRCSHSEDGSPIEGSAEENRLWKIKTRGGKLTAVECPICSDTFSVKTGKLENSL